MDGVEVGRGENEEMNDAPAINSFIHSSWASSVPKTSPANCLDLSRLQRL